MCVCGEREILTNKLERERERERERLVNIIKYATKGTRSMGQATKI
jgi:hypothetical protein